MIIFFCFITQTVQNSERTCKIFRKPLLFIFCSHVEQHSFKSICSISPQCKNKSHLIGLTVRVVLYYNLLFRVATSVTRSLCLNDINTSLWKLIATDFTYIYHNQSPRASIKLTDWPDGWQRDEHPRLTALFQNKQKHDPQIAGHKSVRCVLKGKG